MIQFSIERKLPELIALNRSNIYYVVGWLFGNSPIRHLSITVGDRVNPASNFGLLRPDVAKCYKAEDQNQLALYSGFEIPVTIDAVESPTINNVLFHVEFEDRSVFDQSLGEIKIVSQEINDKILKLPVGVCSENLLAICLTTYQPQEVWFTIQINSIIGQSFRNWICIITDDSPKQIDRDMVQRVVSADPRFYYFENSHQLGFYKNFEYALTLVPPFAKYIALSDQDDEWFPQKIEQCLTLLKGNTQLVYSDLIVKTTDGKILSTTYWKNRKNYYRSQDIDLLSIANTVTGAACIFKSSLLPKILPFPDRYGDIYHDHWIAVMAAGNGGIDYVNEAMYYYMQSPDNVIGFYDFPYRSIRGFFVTMYSSIPPYHGAEQAPWYSRMIKKLAWYTWNFFWIFYSDMFQTTRHIHTINRAALLRGVNSPQEKLLRRTHHLTGLFQIICKVHSRKETLNNLEMYLFLSKITHLAVKLILFPFRKLFNVIILQKIKKQPTVF